MPGKMTTAADTTLRQRNFRRVFSRLSFSRNKKNGERKFRDSARPARAASLAQARKTGSRAQRSYIASNRGSFMDGSANERSIASTRIQTQKAKRADLPRSRLRNHARLGSRAAKYRSKSGIFVSLPRQIHPLRRGLVKNLRRTRRESIRLIGCEKNLANLLDISSPRDTVRFAHYVAKKRQVRNCPLRCPMSFPFPLFFIFYTCRRECRELSFAFASYVESSRRKPLPVAAVSSLDGNFMRRISPDTPLLMRIILYAR